MLRSTARRRIRPTFAAAVLCGIAGGSLTGLGALGFDSAPAVAADQCYGVSVPRTPGSASPALATPSESQNDVSGGPALQDPTADTANESPNPAGFVAGDANTVGAPATGGGGGDDTVAFPSLTTTAPLICPPHRGVATPSPLPDPPTPSLEPGLTPVPVPPVTPPIATPSETPAPPLPPTRNDDGIDVPALGPPTEIGTSGRSAPRTSTPGRTGSITRPEVMARAVSWVVQKVPYSQSRWWTDSAGTFRQDCSGYVSMAWRTDQRINYWTGNLSTITDRVPSTSLRPGDVLNLPGKHVVIFAGWEDVGKTKFRLFEQYATGHTPRFVRNAPLSYYLSRGYGAYRYDGIVETRPTVAAVPDVERVTSTPAPSPVPEPVQHETIRLASASSNLDGTTSTESPESLLVGLPATAWTPAVAEQYTADADVAELLPSDSTPISRDQTSPDHLIAAQQAADTAAADAAEAALAATSPTAIAEKTTAPAGALIAAGLGLLFLAVPLAAVSRGAFGYRLSARPNHRAADPRAAADRRRAVTADAGRVDRLRPVLIPRIGVGEPRRRHEHRRDDVADLPQRPRKPRPGEAASLH